ncbi:hypothetical protein VPH159E362A_0020 [Vibrio phage 159E36-2a]
MSNCNDYPTPDDVKRFKNNAGSVDEFVTSDSDTFVDQDGDEHITIQGIENNAENLGDAITDSAEALLTEIDTAASTQRDQFNATFQAQFAYGKIGNISDYVGDTLLEADKLNSYQYPDDSGEWYGPIQSQTFPITIPSDPSNDSKWALVSAATQEWVSDTFSNPNLLSNHNFLIASPDDITHPSSTPTDYVAGTQIFSGVFVSSDIVGLTYINSHVKWVNPTGTIYLSVPNTNGIEYITEFTASVADFDGKPRTRGVSFALVGDEYRVTVGVDALEDIATNPTPLGSVKFEQGSVATGHSLDYGVVARGSNTPRTLYERFSDVGNILDYENFKVADNWEPAFRACIAEHTVTFVPDGIYRILDPIILPPNKSIIGTNTPTIESDNWTCTIWKSTNNLDEAGNDSIIQMHNNQRHPDYPSDTTRYHSGNQRLENIALMGNISTGYPNVSGGGLDGAQNDYGVYYSTGASVFIRDVCCHNTETMLFMHQPWLSEVTSFQGYGTIETITGTTTNFKSCEALWCGRGGYIFGHTYSTIQGCGCDVPFKAAYTFRNADCLTLISCGNEGFKLAPLDSEYPINKGIYFNFEGGENNVTVIGHRAFYKWQEHEGAVPTNPVYMISTSGNDNVTFVGGEIDRPLPVVAPVDYFRESMILTGQSKVNWVNPPFYFRFPAMYVTKDGGAVYTYTGPNGIYTNSLPIPHDYRADNLVNTLQQGEWTPELFIGASSSGIAYAKQSGTWSRVDDMVTVNFSMLVNAVGGQSGSCTIHGLPFPIDTDEDAYASVRYQNFSGGVASSSGVMAVTGGGSVITLYKPDGQTLLSDSDIPASPTIIIGGSFSYRAR